MAVAMPSPPYIDNTRPTEYVNSFWGKFQIIPWGTSHGSRHGHLHHTLTTHSLQSMYNPSEGSFRLYPGEHLMAAGMAITTIHWQQTETPYRVCTTLLREVSDYTLGNIWQQVCHYHHTLTADWDSPQSMYIPLEGSFRLYPGEHNYDSRHGHHRHTLTTHSLQSMCNPSEGSFRLYPGEHLAAGMVITTIHWQQMPYRIYKCIPPEESFRLYSGEHMAVGMAITTTH